MSAKEIKNGLLESIGNTPLIRLHKISAATGCEILGKAEFMNPGGSVKDRAALGLIEDAENSGRLRPGGTVEVQTILGVSLAWNHFDPAGHARSIETRCRTPCARSCPLA